MSSRHWKYYYPAVGVRWSAMKGAFSDTFRVHREVRAVNGVWEEPHGYGEPILAINQDEADREAKARSDAERKRTKGGV